MKKALAIIGITLYILFVMFNLFDIDIPDSNPIEKNSNHFASDTLPPWIRIMPADSLPNIIPDSGSIHYEYVIVDSLGVVASKKDSTWEITDCVRALEVMIQVQKDLSENINDLRAEYLELQHEMERQSSKASYATLKN